MNLGVYTPISIILSYLKPGISAKSKKKLLRVVSIVELIILSEPWSQIGIKTKADARIRLTEGLGSLTGEPCSQIEGIFLSIRTQFSNKNSPKDFKLFPKRGWHSRSVCVCVCVCVCVGGGGGEGGLQLLLPTSGTTPVEYYASSGIFVFHLIRNHS